MEIDNEIKLQNDIGYIKLIKNTKNYNWELKIFENKGSEGVSKLIEEIKALNNEMLDNFGEVI